MSDLGAALPGDLTVRKYAAQIPVSIELLFDNLGPREGVSYASMFGVQALGWSSDPWPRWLVKEWLKRGYGLGRTPLSCRWPRPTAKRLRDERVAYNAWLREDDDQEDE